MLLLVGLVEVEVVTVRWWNRGWWSWLWRKCCCCCWWCWWKRRCCCRGGDDGRGWEVGGGGGGGGGTGGSGSGGGGHEHFLLAKLCLGQFSDGVKTCRTKCLTAKWLTLIRLIFVALKVCAWVFRRYKDTVLATYVVPSHLAVSFSIFIFSIQ